MFSAFWRAWRAKDDVAKPEPAPKMVPAPSRWPVSDCLKNWQLLPENPDWAGGLRETWTPGEEGASKRLEQFKATAPRRYALDRGNPGGNSTSMLSPHLHFGEVSPRQVWYAIDEVTGGKGADKFRSELGWREFSSALLQANPSLPDAPLRPAFAHFPWRRDTDALKRWQERRTGYPIVDAGMRQLWQTGWMHNRVRMITASFLIKGLLIDWRLGQAWFWDTLVDADLANNAMSWQWVAGSGIDAAPYFRIFNPTLQGMKFDPDGEYVRRWVPELASLPNATLHTPWLVQEATLNKAGIRLGRDYPAPFVEHDAARKRALAAFAHTASKHGGEAW